MGAFGGRGDPGGQRRRCGRAVGRPGGAERSTGKPLCGGGRRRRVRRTRRDVAGLARADFPFGQLGGRAAVANHTGRPVVLEAAHLGNDPTTNRLRNLRALCQRCHMMHDRPYHLAQRWVPYRRRLPICSWGPIACWLSRRGFDLPGERTNRVSKWVIDKRRIRLFQRVVVFRNVLYVA